MLYETVDYDEVQRFNALFPNEFVPLTDSELQRSWWWWERLGNSTVGFCGLSDFGPFDGYGYLKRAAVVPNFRGQGIQDRMIKAREGKARELGMTHVVTECETKNVASANNLINNRYRLFTPVRPWTPDKDYLYWIKDLSQ